MIMDVECFTRNSWPTAQFGHCRIKAGAIDAEALGPFK